MKTVDSLSLRHLGDHTGGPTGFVDREFLNRAHRRVPDNRPKVMETVSLSALARTTTSIRRKSALSQFPDSDAMFQGAIGSAHRGRVEQANRCTPALSSFRQQSDPMSRRPPMSRTVSCCPVWRTAEQTAAVTLHAIHPSPMTGPEPAPTTSGKPFEVQERRRAGPGYSATRVRRSPQIRR